MYKPPSSVSSGSSFSSRKNDFIDDSVEETTTATAKPPVTERVPITIPIHKPLGTSVTSRRESFRVRPSLDRQSIGRASLISRATVESSTVAQPVQTGQKRRLEQVLAQEAEASDQQDTTMEVDADLSSVQSATSMLSNNQSRLETSTHRSLVSVSVISEHIPLSPSSRHTPEAIAADDRRSSRLSTPVRDASPVASLQRQSSPHHSVHHSPVRSPSVISSKRSVSIERSSPRQSPVAPVPKESERRSMSGQSRTASPVPQFESPQRQSVSMHSRSPSVAPDVETTRDESIEKEILEATRTVQVEETAITEKENLEDIASLSLEGEVFENTISETKHDTLSNKRVHSVDMETEEREQSVSHISAYNETAQAPSPNQASVMDSSSGSVRERRSPTVEVNPQNDQAIAANQAQEETIQHADDIPDGAFDIDVDEDVDYNDYTMPENDVQEDSPEEYLGEITVEEISMRAKEIAASMDTQLKRLVASKLGDLHVESLHKLTMEAVRTLR